MEIVRIRDRETIYYPMFESLYRSSFPIYEQRTEQQQTDAFGALQYMLDGYLKDDVWVGFVSYWEFNDYVYVEHLAVDQSLRGQGLGGLMLEDFLRRKAKRVVLEIDPVVDQEAAARQRFYQKYGFFVNPYPHVHPPYRVGYQGHVLVVLTTKGKISAAEYEQFKQDIELVVMAR